MSILSSDDDDRVSKTKRNLLPKEFHSRSKIRKMFVDGWVRLISMKLFALRASDYLRAASPEDRRYLLFNPMTKMKVTTQGEEVVDLVWDAIAAKGFERDQYFSQAAIDIRALPKLEGTVHVNIALLVKFMPNYFFNPGDFPEVPQQNAAVYDDFLFAQGAPRGHPSRSCTG